jgi:hypothetical protein
MTAPLLELEAVGNRCPFLPQSASVAGTERSRDDEQTDSGSHRVKDANFVISETSSSKK